MDHREFGKVNLVRLSDLTEFVVQKRKPYRKWTVEQKRSLVESRIKYDFLFQSCNKDRGKYCESWRFVIKNAKLEEFGTAFVRKQWQNFMSKYRKLLSFESTPDGVLSEQDIKLIGLKWEFFETIHNWMISRDAEDETDLIGDTKIVRQLINKNDSSLQDHKYGKKVLPVKKSSSHPSEPRIRVNPDIFEKRLPTKSKPMTRINVKKDLSNDIHEDNQQPAAVYKMKPMAQTSKIIPTCSQTIINKSTANRITPPPLKPSIPSSTTITSTTSATEVFPMAITSSAIVKQEPETIYGDDNGNSSTSSPSPTPSPSPIPPPPPLKPEPSTSPSIENVTNKRKRKRSYEEKIYRFTKKSTHRIERKIDALCNIFAQIVKQEYPNVNVSSLLNNVNDVYTSSSE